MKVSYERYHRLKWAMTNPRAISVKKKQNYLSINGVSKDSDCNDGKPERKGRGIEIVNQARLFKPLQKCQPATHFPFYVAKDLPDKFLYSSLFNCLPVEAAAID